MKNEILEKYIGKTIAGFDKQDDCLTIKFNDGDQMQIIDAGQSCCEYRYIVYNDDLQDFVGDDLVDVVELGVVDRNSECGSYSHDVVFVNVKTSKGTFTINAHNEHNGYYGGFCISII